MSLAAFPQNRLCKTITKEGDMNLNVCHTRKEVRKADDSNIFRGICIKNFMSLISG